MEQTPSPSSEKCFLLGQVLLRTLGFVGTMVGAVLMTTDNQTIHFFGMDLAAKYNYATALKFYVAANSIASFISLVSIFALIYYARLAKSCHCQKKFFIIFLLDLMVLVCLVSGSSAATTIAYTGKYGVSHAGWMPICNRFGKWCNKILASLISSYTAAFLFLVLTIWSSWRASMSSNNSENSSKMRDNKVGTEFVSEI